MYTIAPIGTIHSCFPEKFGIPRQPGLVPAAHGQVRLPRTTENLQAVDQLETFSHIWLIYLFHANGPQGWKPRVRPPRLGGNATMGVFATRSPCRPNPIGLSVVELLGIDCDSDGEICLQIGGLDILDGTPLLDIKPYLPYSDCVEGAGSGWLQTPLPCLDVSFLPEAAATVAKIARPRLLELITAVLQQDPRPAYHPGVVGDDRVYGCRIEEFDVRWRVTGNACVVVEVVIITGSH